MRTDGQDRLQMGSIRVKRRLANQRLSEERRGEERKLPPTQPDSFISLIGAAHPTPRLPSISPPATAAAPTLSPSPPLPSSEEKRRGRSCERASERRLPDPQGLVPGGGRSMSAAPRSAMDLDLELHLLHGVCFQIRPGVGPSAPSPWRRLHPHNRERRDRTPVRLLPLGRR